MSEKRSGKLRILVAPLDWGLGHATRCIPLIRQLLLQQCEVWLAGEGAQQKLLQQEFPQLPFLPLQGYRIKYAKSASGLIFNLLRQVGQIKKAIQYEQEWLQRMAAAHSFNAIISDNRYGLFHSHIPSVFITHQLQIKSPFGKWSERWLHKKNYAYINRFSACWVPDKEGKENLAGALSHPEKMPEIPVSYLGAVSRFEKKVDAVREKHLLVLLSGPEPQRSILENTIINEISFYEGSATVVRGLPESEKFIPSTNMIQFYNHLPADKLNEEMQKTSLIIARSGYSTVMDIAALEQKSILIPTPGQTEQEYLARYLQAKNFAPFVLQKDFSLAKALTKAQTFSYQTASFKADNQLRETITSFIQSL